MGKASKAIRKGKICNQKKLIRNFLKKMIISIHSFPKTTHNSRIAKPYFAPSKEIENIIS